MGRKSRLKRERRGQLDEDLIRQVMLARLIMEYLENGYSEETIRAELMAYHAPTLINRTQAEIFQVLSTIARDYREGTPEHWAEAKSHVWLLTEPLVQMTMDESSEEPTDPE